MDTQESQCGDGCAYSRQGESGDRYCFVKEMGLYTSFECEEVGDTALCYDTEQDLFRLCQLQRLLS